MTPPTQFAFDSFSSLSSTALSLSERGVDADRLAMGTLATELGHLGALAGDIPLSVGALSYALALLSTGTASDTPQIALRRRLLGSIAATAGATQPTATSEQAIAASRVAAAMAQTLGMLTAARLKQPEIQPSAVAMVAAANYPREIQELLAALTKH